MTAFIWQTLLILGLAYVLGCWIACLARRMVARPPVVVAGPEPVTASPAGVAVPTTVGPPRVPTPPLGGVRPPVPIPGGVREAFRRADTLEPLPEGSRTPAVPASRPLQPPASQSSSSVARFERALTSPAGAIAGDGPPISGAHDLRRIRNIDAALAKQLHDLGVRSFAEIGAWKQADVARISKALGFKGRIEQENWIEQAQILASGRETYYSSRLTGRDGDRAPSVPAQRSDAPSASARPQTQAQPQPRSQPEPAARPAAVPDRAVSQRVDDAATATAAAMAAAAATAAAMTTRAVSSEVKPAAAPPAPPAAPAATRPEASPAEAALQRAAVSARDDLKSIQGITPEIEQLLNAHGVTRYGQIAQWSGAEIERYGRLLGQPARIQRENWVEQARRLVRGNTASDGAVPAQPADLAKPATPITRVQAPSQPVPAAPATTAAPPVQPVAPQSVSAKPESKPESSTPVASSVPSIGAPKPSPAPASEGTQKPPALATAGAAVVASEAVAGAAVASLATIAATALGAKAEPEAAAADASPKPERPEPAAIPLAPPPKPSADESDDEDDADVSEPSRDEFAGLRSVRSEALRGGPPPVGGRGDEIDDLKRIRGIGVLIEKKLNSMGVTRYEQIAKWTSVDIDRVSHVLDFKGRIERENWVEQARILASGGHTEFSRRADRGEFGGGM